MSTPKILLEGLTYDDVLLIPRYSEILPREVSIKSKFTKNITINCPIVSAAMDTVTESDMAIAMAREGGIGVLHKNMSIESVVNKYPQTIGVFLKHGLHCIGCHIAAYETLEQGAAAHGVDLDQFLKDLNEAVKWFKKAVNNYNKKNLANIHNMSPCLIRKISCF